MRYPMEAPGRGCGGLGSHPTAPDQRRAIGSAGERLVHTEEVTGSIPVSPTRSEAMWHLHQAHDGSHSCKPSGQGAGTLSAMAGRRGWGEDSIYFDHPGGAATLRPIGIVRAAGVA